MAKFKNWMVALTLIMGVSFTSCMDSEDNSMRSGTVMAKLHDGGFMGMSDYYFETLDGITIRPTSASIKDVEAAGFKFSESNGEIVQIWYQWDSEEVIIPEGATEVEGVTLAGISSLDSPVEIVYNKGEANDSISDTPIISLEYEVNSEYKYEPYYWDRTTLVLPIEYYLQSKPHSFTLVFYPEEERTDGVAKLYLRHRKGGDSMTTYSLTSWAYFLNGGYSLYCRSFNLEEVLNSASGVSIDKVIVVTEENENSVDLKDKATETKEYTVEYKETEE